MDSNLAQRAAVVRQAAAAASRGLIEREVLVELICLSAVAGEHLLILGPPGTAKSEAVRRVAKALHGRYFEYLLGRFTEPMELFGPVDLRRLKEGQVITDTTGMLPEAEIAFLDELFLGSTAILNTLLGILNERRFRRGHTDLICPLRIAVGAANHLPEESSLAAFADRFLVRVFVEPIADPMIESLLAGGWQLSRPNDFEQASFEDLDALALAARQADLAPIQSRLAHALRLLRRAGIALSDRRAVRSQRLIAAAAALAGRDQPTEADLWPLIYAVPTADEQRAAREVLTDLLAPTDNPTLAAAAAEASLGPLARARRLVEHGKTLLETLDSVVPENEAQDAREARQLQCEGLLREIDAAFSAETRPEDLTALRESLKARLAETPAVA